MANITLTTSYKKISTINLTYGKIYTYAKYTKQDISTKKTTYMVKSTYAISTSFAFDSATTKLDGTSKKWGYTSFKKGSEVTLQELTGTLQHDSSGVSQTKSIKTEISATYGGSGSTSVTIVAPKMNLYAYVTEPLIFTDENLGPVYFYENPTNYDIYPYFEIYADGNSNTPIYSLERNTTMTENPYQLILSSTEKTDMQNTCNQQKYYNAKIGIISKENGTEVGRVPTDSRLEIINALPTYVCVPQEMNVKVSNIYGELDKYIINNASEKRVNVDVSLKKGATLKSIECSFCSDSEGTNILETKTLELDSNDTYSATFTPTNYQITGNKIYLKTTITDSRGYQNDPSTAIEEWDFVDYVGVQISSLSFERVGVTTQFKLNATISYKAAIIGGSSNQLRVRWGVVNEPADPSNFHYIDLTDTTHVTFNADNVVIEDYVIDTADAGNYAIPYNKNGSIYLVAFDKLTVNLDESDVTSTLPTFDCGKNDMNINGQLFVSDTTPYNQQGDRYQVEYTPFRVGDTYTVPSRLSLGGFISSGTTEVLCTVYLPRPIQSGVKPTITSGTFVIRGPQGYVNGNQSSATVTLPTSSYTVTARTYGDNAIEISILRGTQQNPVAYTSISNNTPVSVCIGGLEIEFVTPS